MTNDELCPCGNNQKYINCCGKFHTEKHYAKTAEELMRSRYSAYVKKEITYLINTTHPTTRKKLEYKDIEQWANQVNFINLTIGKISSGLLKDKTGKVEFTATYIANDTRETQHEFSRFKKHQGKWFYLDGKILD